jgi:hypothetical protein
LTRHLQFGADSGTLSEERPYRPLDASDRLAQNRWLNSELGGDGHIGTPSTQEWCEFSLGQTKPVHRGDVEMPYPGIIGGVQGQPPDIALRNLEEACAAKADCGRLDACSS